MRLGLIARADSRGLGLQTYELYRHLHPERTLVIDSGAISPFTQHFDRYPDGLRIPFNGHQLDEDIIRRFLTGLDVVYTAETPYWYPLYDIARELGVRTVCHVNPEFYRHGLEPDLPKPDVVWLPSTWVSERIPHDAILPFPVNRRHLPFVERTDADTFLHIVGRRAIRDRNGTQLVFKAFRRVRRSCKVIIRSQDPVPRYAMPRNVTLQIHMEDLHDHADLYAEGGVLIFPRRFGGNCLPMHEALSVGMPLLMTSCSPQDSFLPPEMLVGARPDLPLKSQMGPLPCFQCTPERLAARIDMLLNDPGEVARLSKIADELAETVSWTTMLPKYHAALEAACS